MANGLWYSVGLVNITFRMIMAAFAGKQFLMFFLETGLDI